MNQRLLVLVLLFLLAFTTAWAAPPEGLSPRLPAGKLKHPRVPAETAVDHIVVKFHEGTRVRLRGNTLVALQRSSRESARLAALGLTPARVNADLHEAHNLLTSDREVRGIDRLFSVPEAELATLRASGEKRSGRELADLDLFYLVKVGRGLVAAEVEALVASLNALASIEIAYVEPPPQIAGDIFPPTPDFEGEQGYLDPASAGGVDAKYAWTIPGGRGQGVKLIDVETGWRTSHEDLPVLFHQGGAPPGAENPEHGTAVLGELVAPDNGYGVTGIANQALAGTERVNGLQGYTTASRIAAAAAALSAGDVILIELHQAGSFTPASPCPCSPFTTCDFVPMEIAPGTWDAIHTATANGIIVVEAGGNGATNLDDPVYQGWFAPSHDSGAILVAASNSGTDRSPTCFTNYGSRFDLHAWGWDVVTLGYGNHPAFPTGDPNQYYTHDFLGTSSATPIVAGAVADLQGVALAHGLGPLTPAAIRQQLKNTGTPQVPGAKHIGPQPNLRAAIDGLVGVPDAEFVAQNVPATMAAGRVYPVSVTLKNVGSETWDPIGPQCNAYRLGSANPYNNGTWVPATRVELPSKVNPGEQVTISFDVTAPSTPGPYNFQWRMVQECVTWFGDFTPNVVVTVQAAPPRDAQILSQSVPSTMEAGKSYEVNIRLRNVGTQSWDPIGPQCNAYRLGSANPYNNSTWVVTRVELPAPVAQGGEVTLFFTVTAPSTPGTYNFQWQMVQECVVWFGDFSPNVPVTVTVN